LTSEKRYCVKIRAAVTALLKSGAGRMAFRNTSEERAFARKHYFLFGH